MAAYFDFKKSFNSVNRKCSGNSVETRLLQEFSSWSRPFTPVPIVLFKKIVSIVIVKKMEGRLIIDYRIWFGEARFNNLDFAKLFVAM